MPLRDNALGYCLVYEDVAKAPAEVHYDNIMCLESCFARQVNDVRVVHVEFAFLAEVIDEPDGERAWFEAAVILFQYLTKPF